MLSFLFLLSCSTTLALAANPTAVVLSTNEVQVLYRLMSAALNSASPANLELAVAVIQDIQGIRGELLLVAIYFALTVRL